MLPSRNHRHPWVYPRVAASTLRPSPVSTLEAFANVLGVRVSALFRDVDPNAGAPAKLKAGRKPGTSN